MRTLLTTLLLLSHAFAQEHPFETDAMRVPELQEMARNRKAGVSGTDRALTREQELAAVKRRSTR